MARAGADLALLLLGGFRVLVDEAMAELAEKGFPEACPSHEFAMRAIDAGDARRKRFVVESSADATGSA